MVRAQVWTLAKKFEGEIKESDFHLKEEELPPLQDGEFLVENLFQSVDPYMRFFASTYEIGQVLPGTQVARVLESKNPEYLVGETVVGPLGWRTHTIVPKIPPGPIIKAPETGDLPKSLLLGMLGSTGICAYFGLLEICQAQAGETVVVSAAGGAVGSHVGQIAKIQGCRVVGITGSDQKVQALKSLGFDHVVNYKTSKNLAEDLKKGAPKGIDCYFDNVGGETSSIVMDLMNEGGRVAVLGSVSAYNAKILPRATVVQPAIVLHKLKLQGFQGSQFSSRRLESFQQNLQWIQEKKLKVRETVTDGFENTPKALIGVMKGENIGKAVVRVKASHVNSESVDFHGARKLFLGR